MTPPSIAALRLEFPAAARQTYLNHAAIACLPARSRDAVIALAESMALEGERGWPARDQQGEETRARVARTLGSRDADHVAFVENTSAGLSMVADGFAWRAGDNIVSAACEYPSNVYPWMQLAERGVELRQVPEREGRVDPDEIASRIDGRTRMLALSWVQYGSGFRSDLEQLGALCRDRDVLFVVDIIQGWGALKIDVERAGVDVAAAAVHKWVLGPEGTAILYLSPRAVEAITPRRAGWRSVQDIFDWGRFDLTYGPGARRFECGTLNYFGLAALGASLELLEEVGPDRVQQRTLALAARAAEGLAERGFHLATDRRPGEESTIVAAEVPGGDPKALVEALGERDILVAERLGRLRISPHVYNTEEEIDHLLESIDSLHRGASR